MGDLEFAPSTDFDPMERTMAQIPWSLKGTEFGSCNCDYGCPCQFNGRPSSPDGSCRAANFVQIDAGHYGDVKLDGLRFAFTAAWPSAVHEGNGAFQLIIDDRASGQQRDALRRIVYSADTAELQSPYSVFMSMCTTIHEPVVARIELECDVEARTAHAEIKETAICDIEPTRNPVTDEPHRAQIVLPDGFHFTKAETASGAVKSTGAVPLNFKDSYACLFNLHISDQGVIRD